jgi:uncharacterized protein
MKKSQNYLIDVNVWIAFVIQNHEHHQKAVGRIESIEDGDVCFCRATQQGFFRLLSQHGPTRGNPISTSACWDLYAQLRAKPQTAYLNEPAGVDEAWQALTTTKFVSPNLWMDAYLQAFAELSGLKIITFDRALAKASGGECLLG